MRRVVTVTVVAAVLTAAALLWLQPALIADWRRPLAAAARDDAPLAPPMPDPQAYQALRESLASWRESLAARHAAAATPAARAEVLGDARLVLESTLPAMMRCWLGTPWDFDGTSAIPGEGGIACGYFVSTVLRDAGFRVHRYHLAQQPSANILRTFLPRRACKLTVGQPYSEFADALAASEPGILIVGLDTHVGFIVVGNGDFRFIHSSGSRPWTVVDEPRSAASVLRESNWRMLGHLTSDDDVLRKWLTSETFAVHGR